MHVTYHSYYGGWVAPNIYFLGMSGVVNFGGLRIGGLSGIWKKFDYKQGTRVLVSHLTLARSWSVV